MNPKIISALDVVSIISLEDCRNHLRLDVDPNDSPPSHPDDQLVLALLASARDWIESYTGLALSPRTMELALDEFPEDEILLPIPPTISVLAVNYVDSNGDPQTVPNTDYVLDEYQTPGWLLPSVGNGWPGSFNVINAVTIRYVVGYESRTASGPKPAYILPATLRIALLLLLGQLYEHREDGNEVTLTALPIGIKAMCDAYRVRTGLA